MVALEDLEVLVLPREQIEELHGVPLVDERVLVPRHEDHHGAQTDAFHCLRDVQHLHVVAALLLDVRADFAEDAGE